jgi:hypothetical protein
LVGIEKLIPQCLTVCHAKYFAAVNLNLFRLG